MSEKKRYRGSQTTWEEASCDIFYDPLTGHMTWKQHSDVSKVGERCEVWNAKGYYNVNYKNVTYLAHRLAFLLLHGRWPQPQVDHIDGDKKNNSAANLREVTNGQNRNNLSLRSRTSSGLTGVTRNRSGTWSALITVEGRKLPLGTYSDPLDAMWIYAEARNCYLASITS